MRRLATTSLPDESAWRSGVGSGHSRGGYVDDWWFARYERVRDVAKAAAAGKAANPALDQVLAREERDWRAREAQASAKSPAASRQQMQEQDPSTSERTVSDRFMSVLDICKRYSSKQE